MYSFAWIAAVRNDDPLDHWTTPAELAVLSAVHSILDNRTGTGWASRQTLASKARVHPSTVSSVIGKARELGWLRVRRSKRRHANEYLACVPETVLRRLPEKRQATLTSRQTPKGWSKEIEPDASGDTFSNKNSRGGGPSLRAGFPPLEEREELEEVESSSSLPIISPELQRLRKLCEVLTVRDEAYIREHGPGELRHVRVLNPWILKDLDPEILREAFRRHPEVDGERGPAEVSGRNEGV